jgi:predicted nucleic acid-binding protein
MIAVDTSVVVAGFASWHQGHRSAAAALARAPRVPAHVLVEASARNDLAGGAIYDALIAATARHAGATLLTRDQRARSIYERMKVRYEIVDRTAVGLRAAGPGYSLSFSSRTPSTLNHHFGW